MANGKRVLVTAGAGGIGLEIARAFVAEGAKVHVCDVDEEALRRVTRAEPAISGTLCDVADRVAVAWLMAEALQNLGGLDILVSNAGISGPTAPVETLEPDDWDAVMGVNLTGAFNVTRLAIPHLKRSPAGVIIVMSSLAAKHGYPNRSPYATSKWGLIGFTKTLAMELGGEGIRVNAILPGAVEGPRMQRVLDGRAQVSGASLEEVAQAALANQSLQRFVTAQEVAGLAVFLASDAARSISGQALSIDGDAHGG
jgi:NAD(P)-dependent dehydrogenase (short-subunit alcohol dehydrogenase family)